MSADHPDGNPDVCVVWVWAWLWVCFGVCWRACVRTRVCVRACTCVRVLSCVRVCVNVPAIPPITIPTITPADIPQGKLSPYASAANDIYIDIYLWMRDTI